MRELFIYYRSTAADGPVLQTSAQRMQRELADQHPGLEARLFKRTNAADTLITWMETYRMIDDGTHRGIDSGLQVEIEIAAALLAPQIHGPRHVEVFESCA